MSKVNRISFIRTAIVVLYSLGVIATITPKFSNFPSVVVIFYYLFVPGYVVILYLGEDYAVLQKIAYSILFGFMIVLSVYSFGQVTNGGLPLPFNVIIPSITIILILLDYVRSRRITTP